MMPRAELSTSMSAAAQTGQKISIFMQPSMGWGCRPPVPRGGRLTERRLEWVLIYILAYFPGFFNELSTVFVQNGLFITVNFPAERLWANSASMAMPSGTSSCLFFPAMV